MLSTLRSAPVYQHGPQVCIYEYNVRNVTFDWCLQWNWFAVLTRRALRASDLLKERTLEIVRTGDISHVPTKSCKLVCSMNVLRVQCNMLWCA